MAVFAVQRPAKPSSARNSGGGVMLPGLVIACSQYSQRLGGHAPVAETSRFVLDRIPDQPWCVRTMSMQSGRVPRPNHRPAKPRVHKVLINAQRNTMYVLVPFNVRTAELVTGTGWFGHIVAGKRSVALYFAVDEDYRKAQYIVMTSDSPIQYGRAL